MELAENEGLKWQQIEYFWIFFSSLNTGPKSACEYE